MAESPLAHLRAHARFAPWNARGLASHVSGLVDAAGVRPTNASARAAPSARAVRFYVANRLMDRPEGVGTSATYNYRHFLQLLTIKIRQREGLNLEAIRAEMRDTTGDALERRVAQWLSLTLVAGVPAAPNRMPTASTRGGASRSPTGWSCTCAMTPRRRGRTPSSPCARHSAPR